jgi:hypothetical protein
MRRWQRLLVTQGFVGTFATAAFAAGHGDHCETSVRRDERSLYFYSDRGDRCEGDFHGAVGKRMRLISLTRGQPSFGSRWPDALDLQWSSVAHDVRLHVEATAPGQYYRMDAVATEAQRQFHWPLDVLSKRALVKPRIAPGDLAFLARGRVPSDARERPVPLQLNADTGSAAPYVAIIRLAGRVTEAYASLDDIGSSGVTAVWGSKHAIAVPTALEAQDTLVLSVPQSTQGPGLYKLVLRTFGERMSLIDVEFFHD